MNAPDPTSDVKASMVPHVLPSVAWAEVDGEAVVYDEIQRKVHVLSPTATLVWGGIDGRTPLEQIAEDLSASFGEALPIVRSDVVELARDLVGRGLIAGAASRDGQESSMGEVRDDEPESRHGPRFLIEPPSG